MLSLLVPLLIIGWIVKDTEQTRRGLVASMAILFLSAVMMVIGGDMIMIADMALSAGWGYSAKKYLESKR